jgi:hypothetical protein
MSNNECNKFCPAAFGFSLGILWGLGLLIVGLINHWEPSFGHPFIQTMSSVYIGYKSTIEGSLIGFAWGFIDFFIFGFLIAYIYNKMMGCSKCSRNDA